LILLGLYQGQFPDQGSERGLSSLRLALLPADLRLFFGNFSCFFAVILGNFLDSLHN
jgi:hypothetical protein